MTLRFVLEQGASRGLCFAVGILRHEALSQWALGCSDASGVSVVLSFLFAVSRSTDCLKASPEIGAEFMRVTAAMFSEVSIRRQVLCSHWTTSPWNRPRGFSLRVSSSLCSCFLQRWDTPFEEQRKGRSAPAPSILRGREGSEVDE